MQRVAITAHATETVQPAGTRAGGMPAVKGRRHAAPYQAALNEKLTNNAHLFMIVFLSRRLARSALASDPDLHGRSLLFDRTRPSAKPPIFDALSSFKHSNFLWGAIHRIG